MISVVHTVSPASYELLVTEVVGDGVTIRTLTSINAPASDGPVIGPLYAYGTAIIAMRGDQYYTVAIDLGAGTATWGEPHAVDTANQPIVHTSDPKNSRLVGYGSVRFTPPMSFTLDPSVVTRSLSTDSWSPTVATGVAPPSTPHMPAFSGWIAYEETRDRLFVVAYHTVPTGSGGTQMVKGLWSVSPATGVFTQHISEYRDGSLLTGQPYAMDVAAQRTVELRGDELTLRSLRAGSEGEVSTLTQDGALPPRAEAAAMLGDGRLVILANDRLLTLDPAETNPRWTQLGDLAVPREHHFASALVHDPIRNRSLLVGGAPSAGEAPTTFLVTAVVEDGSSTAPVVTTGTQPSPRVRHSAIVVGSELFLVGGFARGFAGGTPDSALDDVWALHLDTLAWRRVGTLQGGRAGAALRARPDGQVWIIGGYDSTAFTGVPSVESIDPGTGVVSTISTSGAWPPNDGAFNAWTTLGEGILAIDLGTGDSSGQLWQLVPDGAGSAHWMRGDACTSRYAFLGVVGVPDAGEEGWIVGEYTWHAEP
jgi:hypothetical protein